MEIIILFWILLESRTPAYQMVGTETVSILIAVWTPSLLCKRASICRAVKESYILPTLTL